jgi:hypothetical protein
MYIYIYIYKEYIRTYRVFIKIVNLLSIEKGYVYLYIQININKK